MNIDNVASFAEAAVEVSERLKSFCHTSIKGGECKILNNNLQVNIIKRKDSSQTAELREWQGSDIEFLMEFNIKEGNDAMSGSLIVGISVFCHLREVMTQINRIKSTIEGDINRTNRKWRRKLNAEKNTFE